MWCLLPADTGPGWDAGNHEGLGRCSAAFCCCSKSLSWLGEGAGMQSNGDMPGQSYKVLFVLQLPTLLLT